MIYVDLLNGNVGEGDPEEQRTSPPILGERRQGATVSDYHENLRNENGCQDVPHVHHLLLGV